MFNEALSSNYTRGSDRLSPLREEHGGSFRVCVMAALGPNVVVEQGWTEGPSYTLSPPAGQKILRLRKPRSIEPTKFCLACGGKPQARGTAQAL